MSDIEMSECCTCGFKWMTGQDGSHSCADNLSLTIDDLVKQNKDLSTRIERLEFSLDDLDCYIADADMKNEELKKQIEKLREVLAKALEYVDADFENKIKPYNPAHLGRVIAEALKES